MPPLITREEARELGGLVDAVAVAASAVPAGSRLVAERTRLERLVWFDGPTPDPALARRRSPRP